MRLGACVLTAVLIGGGGYAALAHRYYDVPLNDLSGWMLNHRNRPEAEQGAWGNTANLTPENLETVLANHLAYTVLLPGLRTTNDADIVRVSGGSRWGQYSFGFYGLFAGWLVFSVLRGARQGMSKGSVEHFMLVSVAFAWLIVRVLFSTWWSPGTPFLFAVMSIPALWLLCLLFLSAPAASRRTLPDPSSLRRRVIAVAVVAAIVWIHNYMVMIAPLRSLSAS